MISVICPIYNEEKYIERCVESVLRQDYPQEELEILFVDGLSTDRTRELLRPYLERYSFIHLLDNPERIVPYAMNRGIRAARGEVVIRLDAHAIYPANYFSVLVSRLNELHADNVGAVCRTLPAHNTWKCRAIAFALSCPFGMGNAHFRIGADKIMLVDTVPFGCFPKWIFDKVGLYDVDLVRNQDDELNARIIKHGGKIYLLPELIVDYYARDTIKKTGTMFYQYGLYKPLVNCKLGAPATVRQFIPVGFVLGIIGCGILGIFWPVLYIVLGALLCCYIIIAVTVGVRELYEQQTDWRQVFILPVIFFVVHWSYGWGYLQGILKLLFHRSFNVRANH